MEIDSMPAELDEVERRIMQLEIEREALRRRRTSGLEGAAAEAREGAGRPQGRARTASPHWQQEKEAIQTPRKLKEELEQVRLRSSARSARGDYAKASELQYGKLPELERKIKEQEARWPSCRRTSGCSRRKSTRRTSPRSSAAGPASRSAG